MTIFVAIAGNENNYFALFFFYRKSDSSGGRQIRCTPDWGDNAVSGDHLWVPTNVSGDCCYVGDNDCTVSIDFRASDTFENRFSFTIPPIFTFSFLEAWTKDEVFSV